jgi:hypothetical protein
MSMKNSNDTIGNRSLDLPVCSAVPQPLRHRVPPMYMGLRVKYPFFLSEFKENYFLEINSKNKSSLINVRPVGAELFHPDGQTDKTEPFANLRTRLKLSNL